MRFITYVMAGFVVLEAPKYLSLYWQITLYQQIGVFCLLAIGLNIVVGFAGLLDLGYVAFYAIGAYTTAYFSGSLPVQPPFHLNPHYPVRHYRGNAGGRVLSGYQRFACAVTI